MKFWATLAGYELVWFCAVIGAGRGRAWPAIVGTLLFTAWSLATSRHRRIELRLIVVALVLGVLLETIWVRSGLFYYAAPWPFAEAPAWILALWVAFALTIVPLFGYLHTRPWMAAAFGALGGPLAYLGAARGWHAVTMTAPVWQVLLWLALGWGFAMPLLTMLARHWLQASTPTSLSPHRSAP